MTDARSGDVQRCWWAGDDGAMAAYHDDEWAWAYVGSIAVAVEEASRINALKVRATYVMFVLTVLHIAAVVASAAVFGA